MSTSGTINFAPTLVDIFEEAFERATGDELRHGYQVRSMRRSLNLLLLDWQNRGYNLWMLENASVNTAIGVATVTLATDCVDTIEVLVNTAGSDIPLMRYSVPDYAALPNKTTTGRPSAMLVRREASPVTLTLWPVPDQIYALNYWYLRRVQDAGNGGNEPDVPIRFIPALIAGLAYYMAQKIPEAAMNLPTLQSQYEEALFNAQNEDREKAPLRLVPRVGRIGRGR